MTQHPYSNLPKTQFWSKGVQAPLSAKESLAITPLLDSLTDNDSIVSGGSCFAQYIGEELTARNFNYLRSELSGERTESFGLGNIYTIAQLKQWLEFALGKRAWADDCIFVSDDQWYDLLLPHRLALHSEAQIHEHRIAIKNEILSYLKKSTVLIFTVGLTETWRNQQGDIYPTCPGTLVGEFDETVHVFHNCTFTEIHADLHDVENMLLQINANINFVYTVSPVPLTATASDEHVLLASTYSKSVIRAAVGQYCEDSERATYFPSYELISHHTETDWRFDNNLRTISESGVRYVMGHAFGENTHRTEAHAYSENTHRPTAQADLENVNHSKPQAYVGITDNSELQVLAESVQSSKQRQDAICEEELLDSYSRLVDYTASTSNIVLIGDCHLEKLASGFEATNVDVIGGIVMHGSSFNDSKFDLCPERIFVPKNSKESKDIWFNIHNKLTTLNSDCHILTNIGFHTHRTIIDICNHFKTYVLNEDNVADYFEKFHASHIYILSELKKYGNVWMIEDPDFHAFIKNKDTSQMVRDKNFHIYCNYMRKVAQYLDIGYLNPCDAALKNLLEDSTKMSDIIAPSGFLGHPKYYEYCAAVVNESIGNNISVTAIAA